MRLIQKTYLDVSFEDKDFVKERNAKWDQTRRQWYTLNDNKYKDELIERFKENDIPILLQGE